MTSEPAMLPHDPRQVPFVRGWGPAGVLILPISVWLTMGAVTASGLDPRSSGASLLIAVVLAVVSVTAFLGLRGLQRRGSERRVERYAQDRLPSLKRIAAYDAYGRGGFTDLEEAWRSVEGGAMAFFDTEMAIVRVTYRDYHRLCWLPVQYVAALPAAMAVYSLAYAVAGAAGLVG